MENKQVMDNYLVTLSNIVTDVERAYQLQNDSSDSVKYADMEIVELVTVLNMRVSTFDKDERDRMHEEAGRALVLLSYTRDRLNYFNKKRLDFSKYPGMTKVAEVLLKFTKATTIDESSLRDVNMIVELLSEIDNRYMNYRGGLGYRYLRAFVVLVVFGNFFNAAIVANFILCQFITKGAE